MYRHVHLATRPALDALTGLLPERDSASSRLSLQLAHTRSITLDFCLRILRLEVSDISTRLVALLSRTSRLEAFGDAGVPLGLLEPDIFEVIKKTAAHSLRRLTGFTLHADTFALGQGTCIEQLAEFRQLEELSTGPFWLPASLAPCPKAPIDGQSLFPHLRIIQATFTPTLPLVIVLAADPLPCLREIKAASWEYTTLRTFLQAHGHKIHRLDLNREYRQTANLSTDDKTAQLLALCPNLRYLACHSVTELEGLIPVHHDTLGTLHLSNLYTLHLSTPFTASPWRDPEREDLPTSFPFFPMSTSVMMGLLGRKGWEKRLPRLKTMSIYASDQLAQEDRLRAIQKWTGVLRDKDINLVVI